MLIATLADLKDATEFERFAMDNAMPQRAQTTIDLRDPKPPTVQIFAYSIGSPSQADLDAAVARFQPLLFGAAWKCLDLALELGLLQAGILPKGGKEYRIVQKVKEAANAQLLPCSSDHPVWQRIVALYDRTSEIRHCLTHRSFRLNAAGDMTAMFDRTKKAVRDFAIGEQRAFVRATLLVLQAVFHGASDARTRALLVHHLDELDGVHGLGTLGEGQARPVEHAVLLEAQVLDDGHWQIDVDTARARFKEAWPSESLANLRITPLGKRDNVPLVGRLEEAPAGSAVVFDPANTPPWMRE